MAEGGNTIGKPLSDAQYEYNFKDVEPVLDKKKALVESSRCYFCHDAPCVEACPTAIDVPNFIRMISTGNTKGAAITIFESNILGGMCARVCPTEILCEQACVRNHSEDKPVDIGALQRYATDSYMAQFKQPFTMGKPSGKKIAIVGAGPAGLSCAHRLAVLGHAVDLFDARPKLGGLNEYGIAAYKVADQIAQREVDFILDIGGITAKPDKVLGRDFSLGQLRRDYDAVFVAIGLKGVNKLGIDGEDFEGVMDAVAYIADLRQASDKSRLPIGNKIVVIGGGNTAIDIAVQTKRLGARDVTLAYRRGPEQMSATPHEQEFAQVNGVKIKHWANPVRVLGQGQKVIGVEFEYCTAKDGKLVGTGEKFVIEADMVFKAIGQMLVTDPLNVGDKEILVLEKGKIKIDETGATSLPGVFAGGDCASFGQDLTVWAVEAGKRSAQTIDQYIRNK